MSEGARPETRGGLRVAFYGSIVVALTALGVLTFQYIQRARYDAFISYTRGRVSHVHTVLRQYVNLRGELMPSRYSPGNSVMRFSWRLAALEKLAGESGQDQELRDLVQQVKYDQAWNAPANLQVASELCKKYPWWTIGEIYNKNMLIYAVVGDRSFWSTDQARSKDLWERSGDKPLLVAVPTDNPELFEPRDLTEDQVEQLARTGLPVVAITVGGKMFQWKDRESATTISR